jgi:diguanylate cyclase (GGDEF)-like protein
MMAGTLTPADESKGYYAGAATFLHKPFTQPAVLACVRTYIRLAQLERRVEELTLTDNVTGLPNRRSFMERMAIEWPRAVREKQFVSYLLINIDNYEEYEEAYGHTQAMKMLGVVAKSFTRMIRRATDMVARLDSDDFAAILPHTGREGACRIAEMIRERIETLKIVTEDGTLTTTTISVGVVSSTPAVGDKADWMYEEAARLLHLAKANGRNRVECGGDKADTGVI